MQDAKTTIPETNEAGASGASEPEGMVGQILSRPMTRRGLLTAVTRSTLAVMATSAGGSLYAANLEPNWVDVTHVTMRLQRLAPEFAGYRLVQISDLHVGDWTTLEHLRSVVATVNALNADLVAVTGDFITRMEWVDRAGLTEALRGLQARDGVVAVLGNHDHWSDADGVRAILRAAGLDELENRSRTLRRGGGLLHIAGVDDVWTDRSDLQEALAGIPSQGAVVLLAHEPDFADTVAQAERVDLQLSGHSHGGQVVIPFLGPLQLPMWGRKYHTGLYRVQRATGGSPQGPTLHLYTNRGIGMLSPHVRVGCRPEISVFELGTET
jgi:uncharacterized protein